MEKAADVTPELMRNSSNWFRSQVSCTQKGISRLADKETLRLTQESYRVLLDLIFWNLLLRRRKAQSEMVIRQQAMPRISSYSWSLSMHMMCPRCALCSPEEIDRNSLFQWQRGEGRLMNAGALSLIHACLTPWTKNEVFWIKSLTAKLSIKSNFEKHRRHIYSFTEVLKRRCQ